MGKQRQYESAQSARRRLGPFAPHLLRSHSLKDKMWLYQRATWANLAASGALASWPNTATSSWLGIQLQYKERGAWGVMRHGTAARALALLAHPLM